VFVPPPLVCSDTSRDPNRSSRARSEYQERIKTRNASPAELERQYGYDTKHAMHLIRLLRMATEIVATGTVQVCRPAAESLRAIRRGALSFEALIERAEPLGAEVQSLAAVTSLPACPDEAALNRFCADLVDATHRRAS
jgi:hypothetical protein